MGSGSTIAAAAACGLRSIGLEVNTLYFKLATKAIPALAQYIPREVNGNGAKR
jgi:DNA modification methylase